MNTKRDSLDEALDLVSKMERFRTPEGGYFVALHELSLLAEIFTTSVAPPKARRRKRRKWSPEGRFSLFISRRAGRELTHSMVQRYVSQINGSAKLLDEFVEAGRLEPVTGGYRVVPKKELFPRTIRPGEIGSLAKLTHYTWDTVQRFYRRQDRP